ALGKTQYLPKQLICGLRREWNVLALFSLRRNFHFNTLVDYSKLSAGKWTQCMLFKVKELMVIKCLGVTGPHVVIIDTSNWHVRMTKENKASRPYTTRHLSDTGSIVEFPLPVEKKIETFPEQVWNCSGPKGIKRIRATACGNQNLYVF
ncbi:hypothetical protein M514_06705, partial [Trichuris suis]